MSYYTFFGRLLPERGGSQVLCVFPMVTFTLPETEAKVEFAFSIEKGRIVAVANCEEGVDVLSARNYIELAVAKALDSFTYLNGVTYAVEFEEVLGADARITPLDRGLPLQHGEVLLTHEELIRVLFRPSIMSHHAGQALADLRQAIRCPHDTGFFCYRGIESIRQAFVATSTKEKGRKTSFEQMRKALRIEESYLKPMKATRDHQGHGVPHFMSGQVRLDHCKRLWRVIHRFFVYLLRGESPLPADDFECLA